MSLEMAQNRVGKEDLGQGKGTPPCVGERKS